MFFSHAHGQVAFILKYFSTHIQMSWTGRIFLNVNMRIGEPVALTLMFICSQTECYKKSRWLVTRGESTGSGKIKKKIRELILNMI